VRRSVRTETRTKFCTIGIAIAIAIGIAAGVAAGLQEGHGQIPCLQILRDQPRRFQGSKPTGPHGLLVAGAHCTCCYYRGVNLR